MPIRIYVSPDPTVPFGDSWELVGTLDSSGPTMNEQAAKALQMSPRGNATLSAEFYLSGDPASRWVQAESEHEALTRRFPGNGNVGGNPLDVRAQSVTPVAATSAASREVLA